MPAQSLNASGAAQDAQGRPDGLRKPHGSQKWETVLYGHPVAPDRHVEAWDPLNDHLNFVVS